MADAPVVLCDPLCFIVNKYGKTDVKALSSALFDFYSTDVLSDAKKRLLEDVDKLNLKSNRPHIPHRRDGDGRLQKEVDDLLLLVTYLDEQKALDSLPKYVSGSPDNMPSLRLYEGDLSGLMTLLHSMSDRITEIGSALAAITHDVRTLQRAVPPVSTQTRAPVVNMRSTAADCNVYNHSQGGLVEELPGDFETAAEVTDRNMDCQSATTTSWALQVSTPICSDNRFAILSTDDDDQQRQQPFTTVVHSRRAKRRQPSSSQQRQQQQRQERQQQSSAAGQQQQQTTSARRTMTLFGKSTATSSIAAARKQCKKSVFCVDNVVTSCTVDDIRSFVAGLNVEVISCFEAIPRRRPDESVELDRKKGKVGKLSVYVSTMTTASNFLILPYGRTQSPSLNGFLKDRMGMRNADVYRTAVPTQAEPTSPPTATIRLQHRLPMLTTERPRLLLLLPPSLLLPTVRPVRLTTVMRCRKMTPFWPISLFDNDGVC